MADETPSPDSLANDPILGPLLQDPALLAALSGGMGAPAQPVSLAEALYGSAMDVTGRQGLTGSGFSGPLPSWAADLAPEVLGNPDFDPYLGIVSEEGDERVFVGREAAPEPDLPAPLAPGMVRDDSKTAYVGGSFADLDSAERAQGDIEFRSGGQRAAEDVTTPGEKPKGGGKQDKTLTAMQAINLPYTWGEEKIAEAMERMKAAGLNVTSFDMGSNSLVSVWGALVQRAAMTYSLSEGERKVTPWDVLDMYKAEAKAAGLLGETTRTRTATSVADITEGQAWATLRKNLQGLLGRDPTDQEVRDFTYRMNQLAAQNPSISKTIATYEDGRLVDTETTRERGFTGADMAQEAYEQAQSNPEYAEFQAATTYFDAAMGALGAIGQT